MDHYVVVSQVSVFFLVNLHRGLEKISSIQSQHFTVTLGDSGEHSICLGDLPELLFFAQRRNLQQYLWNRKIDKRMGEQTNLQEYHKEEYSAHDDKSHSALIARIKQSITSGSGRSPPPGLGPLALESSLRIPDFVAAVWVPEKNRPIADSIDRISTGRGGGTRGRQSADRQSIEAIPREPSTAALVTPPLPDRFGGCCPVALRTLPDPLRSRAPSQHPTDGLSWFILSTSINCIGIPTINGDPEYRSRTVGGSVLVVRIASQDASSCSTDAPPPDSCAGSRSLPASGPPLAT
ncbi:hypothetical protein GEV33_010903 [Tenebrio molitor]|uniref:Uncharacterized protein n=1 Tax=Tenebrio molitor TaxID=7067 RepID=A0A8J6HCD1_TENMO|nr:hypothetical protein GEV33_010903 [Tenebrio molitor]